MKNPTVRQQQHWIINDLFVDYIKDVISSKTRLLKKFQLDINTFLSASGNRTCSPPSLCSLISLERPLIHLDIVAAFYLHSIWTEICRWIQELMGSQTSLVCNDGPPPWPWHTHTHKNTFVRMHFTYTSVRRNAVACLWVHTNTHTSTLSFRGPYADKTPLIYSSAFRWHTK